MEGQSAAVQDVMINRKIPAVARGRWPIVATSSHPVWLVGHLLDSRAAIQMESAAKQVIRLHCFQTR
jgi:hypothetical protein